MRKKPDSTSGVSNRPDLASHGRMPARRTLTRLFVVALVASVTLALLVQLVPGKLASAYLFWIVPLLIPATLIVIDAASTDGLHRRAGRWGAATGLATTFAGLVVWAAFLSGWEFLYVYMVFIAVPLIGLAAGFIIGRVAVSRAGTPAEREPVCGGIGMISGAVLTTIVVTFVYASYVTGRIALAYYQLADPTLPPEKVSSFLEDPMIGTSSDIKYAVAAHPMAPPQTLARLYKVPNLKRIVLSNPSVPCNLLEGVLQYHAVLDSTRERLVRHYRRTCPQSARAVEWAANPATPPEDLALAVASGNRAEQWAAWTNPSTPVTSLLHHLEKVMAQDQLAHLWRIAEQPDARPEVLATLAGDDHPDTLRKVAANPNTPEPILRRLAALPVRNILNHVGGNPSAPADLLVTIVRNNPGSSQLQGVARNPNTPPALLREMADWSPRSDDPAAVHKLRLYRDLVLPLIAQHPDRVAGD